MQKLLRFDTFVAVCALLISSLSCVATIFQTRVIANQLSASVWPYLSFEASFQPTGVVLELSNDGLGPALIRSATVAVDGKPVAGWQDVSRVLRSRLSSAKGVSMQSKATSLGPGSVIRAGAMHHLLTLQFRAKQPPGTALLAWFKRTSITVCYCSTLDRCWLTHNHETTPPEDVRDCGSPKSIDA